MTDPEVISPNEIWKPGWGIDPAKYLIDPGQVRGLGMHSAGQLAHARPYISNGPVIFVFPVGTEGFRATGQAQLGLHHYIGDNAVDGTVIHYEEGRITLDGTFPGLTSQENMVQCRNILRSPPVADGLILWAPGVFNREQYVLAETWDFTHDKEDRTHSIEYSISLVRIGDRGAVADLNGTIPPAQPGANTEARGKTARMFVVRAGAQTLRAISNLVYGNADLWPQIVALNGNMQTRLAEIPAYQLPTYKWPIGTRFNY